MDVREDGDAHRQSLAARSAGIGAGPRVARRLAAPPGADASPGAAGPGGRLARVRRAGRAALRRDDEAVVRAGRATRRRRPGSGRRRGPRPPAGRPRAPRRRRSLFQATSDPPRASSGNASSTSSGSGATARATTAGQRSRWRGSAARSSTRTGATSTVGARPVAATAVSRNDAFLRIDSTSSARSAGNAAASGMPGEAAAAAEVDERPDPEPAKLGNRGEAVDDVAAGRARAGRGAAVRLIAAFQARRRRTWPSIAARAAGVSASPIAARPSSRAASNSGGSSGRPSNARRERIPRTVQALLLSVVPGGPSGLRSRRRRSSHRWSISVFRGRSGSRPGFPVPLASPVTRVTSVRMPDVSRRSPGRQRGYPRIHPPTPRLWITEAASGSGGGPRSDGSAAASTAAASSTSLASCRRRRSPPDDPLLEARLLARARRAAATAARSAGPAGRGRTRTRPPAPTRRRGRRPSAGEVPGDRQAEARAGHALVAGEPLEPLEDPVPVARADAAAVVADDEHRDGAVEPARRARRCRRPA